MNGLPESVRYGGVDVHKKSSQVTFRDGDGKIVARAHLNHLDRDGLRERLSSWPDGLELVLEASFGWAWLSDLMKEVGLMPRLANCAKVQKMREARGWAKNNKKDADLLSLLPMEKYSWWEVWLTPQDVRDRRERMRFRSSLVAIRTGTKNRIHALLMRHGIFHEEVSDLFGVEGHEFLAAVCRQDELLLPGALETLHGLVLLLDHVGEQIEKIEERLNGELVETPLVKLLDTIPGFGLILSHTVVSEVGEIERFRSQRHLARYSLVAPVDNETGDDDEKRGAPIGRHIGHKGNRTLKWTLIEAAHGAVRHGGKWRKIFDRYTKGGTQNVNRGYIKVARQLVTAVYAVWKKQQQYNPKPPLRPGVDKRKRKTRGRDGDARAKMIARVEAATKTRPVVQRREEDLVPERASSMPLRSLPADETQCSSGSV